MSNPYLDGDTEPTPQPEPPPVPTKPPHWLWLVAAIAIAGIFLPPSDGWQSLPIPGPIPIIDTKPDPAKTEGSWVVVVEQTEARTPAVAKVLADLPYWQSLATRGLNWRHYDADSDDAAPFLVVANAVGLPAVMIIGGQGELKQKVLAKFPLSSRDELDAKIKEATGR